MKNIEDFILEAEENSLKDYIKKIRNNLFAIILITAIGIVIGIAYALHLVDIYQSTTTLKISKPQGNILESSMLSDFQGFTNDRFISTEIGIMRSYSIRYAVAKTLIDSFKTSHKPEEFSLILQKTSSSSERIPLSPETIAGILGANISIEQQKGIDLVDISANSPSPYEAALIVNCYAKEYVKYNLSINRKLLTNVKDFLAAQVKDKQLDLSVSEDLISKYQAQNGIIALDVQSQSLITQLANFEAQRDNVKIELLAATKTLSQLKDELKLQSPKIASYLESMASQSYYKAIQDQIANLEVTKDMAMLNKKNDANNPVIRDYESKISQLKEKLNVQLESEKNGILASNPDVVKNLMEKIISTDVETHSLTIQSDELNKIIRKYELQFNKLPSTSIEYARLERRREADEKLFSLLEQKHQEAQINELSQPGNVIIIDGGIIPQFPSKPDRQRIVLIGLLIGAGLSLAFVFIKEYFSNSIKTPDDIENKNINVLAWVPAVEELNKKNSKEVELIVNEKPDSIASESFKSLRQRVQYSKIEEGSPLKTILVTSSMPVEGKTFVSLNLAGSFAQLGKKTLLLDLDLRKPRVHKIFKQHRKPGVIDYLFNQVQLQDIINRTEMESLYFISSGTISPNPSEMIASRSMKNFISELRDIFDIIIIDSAPMITVVDTEIISSLVDASILVVSANKTEFEPMQKAVELIQKSSKSFIGTVLNKFVYKNGYSSYYKYYYYYSHNGNGNGNGNGRMKKSSRMKA